MKTNHVQKNIMRRVYYAVALRLVAHPLVANTAIFGSALVVFSHMVHVERVIDAFLSISVASVPHFVMNALSNGEAITLVSLAAMGYATLRTGKYVGHIAAYHQKSRLVAR